MFRHIVLFRIRDGVPDAAIAEALEALRELRAVAGAEEWRVERSTDERKGRIIVEDATFRSRAEFTRFRDHPVHKEVGERLSELSDWLIGDYEVSGAATS